MDALTQLLKEDWALHKTPNNIHTYTSSLQRCLHACFVSLNQVCCEKFKESGSTGTVHLILQDQQSFQRVFPLASQGTLIITANVGDSHAYVGPQDGANNFRRINVNHRLGESNLEQKRIRDSGGEISKSKPYRLWPGKGVFVIVSRESDILVHCIHCLWSIAVISYIEGYLCACMQVNCILYLGSLLFYNTFTPILP